MSDTVAISLYDASVASFLQTLGGVACILAKGEEAAAAGDLDLDQLLKFKLRDDMLPFSFQVISVWHHSLGAVEGIRAGLFEPPPVFSGTDYQKLRDLVAEATSGLESVTREAIDALQDKPMVFRFGEREVPFTITNFILSFSLPNFYFHATTAYDILRMHGVPLGKFDYLGTLRVGTQ